MYRERLFKRAEDALRQAHKWALNLIQSPPQPGEFFRGTLL
jgi:cellobiose-specific phosphotransferase system component IIA